VPLARERDQQRFYRPSSVPVLVVGLQLRTSKTFVPLGKRDSKQSKQECACEAKLNRWVSGACPFGIAAPIRTAPEGFAFPPLEAKEKLNGDDPDVSRLKIHSTKRARSARSTQVARARGIAVPLRTLLAGKTRS